MIFGDPKTFAIESITEPHLSPPSPVWGRMQLLVDWYVFGDISDEHCGLYGAYCGFRDLMSHQGQLWHSSFDGLGDNQIHDVVRHAIYGDDNRSSEKVMLDSQTYRPFDFLTNWGEQFDGFASVIFQRDDKQTTIAHVPHSAFARTRPEGSPVSFHFSTASFNSATMKFLTWFEAETKRLS